MFPGWRALAFSHHVDRAVGGRGGLAHAGTAVCSTSTKTARVFFVCGESFGGTVALTMAHLRPERVAGLILFSTFGWHPSMLARRGAGALAVWSFLGHRISNSAYRAGPRGLGAHATRVAVLERAVSELHLATPRAFRRVSDQGRAVADVRCSAVARHAHVSDVRADGTWDPVVPASAGRELANRIPNASLHSVRGGHLVHLVQAKRVGDLISDWARDLD